MELYVATIATTDSITSIATQPVTTTVVIIAAGPELTTPSSSSDVEEIVME